MARLLQNGFELNSTTSGVEFDGSSGTFSIDGTIKRSGGYSLKSNPTSSNGYVYWRLDYLTSLQGNYYARFYIYVTTLPSIDSKVFTIWGFKVSLLSIRLNTVGGLELWNDEDSVQVGSDSPTLATSKWYRVEVRYDNTTMASTVVEGKVDGTSFASGTVNHATNLSAGLMEVGFQTASTTGVAYFDDVALNDNSGSFQNGYPGNGRIIHLKPNAAGDNSDWTNDYTAVNEVTPNDATNFVASNTLNQTDDHNLEASGLPSDATINVVTANARFSGAAGSSNSQFVLRIKREASGTTEEGTAYTPNNTTWRTNSSTGISYTYPPSLILYDEPGASTTAWTSGTLDTAQIGYRISTAATNNAQISTVWMSVDYSLSQDFKKIDDFSNFGGLAGGSREVIRDSNGNLYAALLDSINSTVEVWKSTDDGSTWSEIDSTHHPSAKISSSVAVAIDNDDNLHIAYIDSSNYCAYVKVSLDLYGTPEETTTTAAVNSNRTTSIAVDSNNIPHAVYAYRYGPSDERIYYVNRVGGSWNQVNVANGASVNAAEISINASDFPVLATVYYLGSNNGVVAYLGNTNNATSFTSNTIISSTYADVPSIAVDSNGDVWVAYVDTDQTISIAKQSSNWTSAWTTSNSASGGYTPSLAIVETNKYVFYYDSSGNITYQLYDGSWHGEHDLEIGTFRNVKTRWALAVNYDSSANSLLDTYAFSYKDSEYLVNLQDPGGRNSVGQAFSGDNSYIDSVDFYIYKTGTATGYCYAELYNLTGSKGSTATPTGTALATSDPILVSSLPTAISKVRFHFDGSYQVSSGTDYFIVFKNANNTSTNGVNIGYDGSTPSHSGNLATLSNTTGSWSASSGSDLCFILNRTTSIKNSLRTYYFNDSTPSDPNSVWTNDANAFDSDDSTRAENSSQVEGSNSVNYLYGQGTTAPSSDARTIKNVYARFYGFATAAPGKYASAEFYTSGLGETLGLVNSPSGGGASPTWQGGKLNVPSGGWTWSKVNSLEVKLWPNGTGGCFAYIYKIEVVVQTSDSPAEIDYVFSDLTDAFYDSFSLSSAVSLKTDQIDFSFSAQATTYTDNNSVIANIKTTATQANNSKADVLVIDNVVNNSSKASIVVTNSKDNSAIANIKSVYSKDNSSKANIIATGQQANNANANILVSDNTQNNSSKASIVVTNTNNNSSKASIVVTNTNGNNTKANILNTYTDDNSSKADVIRIDEIQNNSSKANFTLLDREFINNVKANVIVIDNVQANSVKANIPGEQKNSVLGNVLRTGETKDNNTKASIVATETNDNDVLANILATQQKDNSVKALITNLGQQTNNVEANIIKIDELQDNSAKANVLATYTSDQSSKASIVATNTYDNSVLANLTAQTQQQNSTKGNVLVTPTKDNNSIGNILTSVQSSNSAKSYIGVTWTYQQDFNSLADATLEGQDGWIKDVGGDFIVGNYAPYEGAKSAQVIASSTTAWRRPISFCTDGIVFCAIKKSNTNGDFYFYLNSDYADVYANIKFASNGNIYYYNYDTSYELLQPWSPNVWYVIGLNFDTMRRQYRYSVDGASWSSWIPMNSDPTDRVNSLNFDLLSVAASTTVAVDYISTTYLAKKDNSAEANISKTETDQNSSLANILQTISSDNSTKANIPGESKNNAIANILVSQSKDNDVKANIVVTGQAVNSVGANILRSNEVQDNSSKGDILVSDNQTSNQVKGNISNFYTADQSAKANILAVYTNDNSVKADILNTYEQSNNVKANIPGEVVNSALANFVASQSKDNNVVGNILSAGQSPQSVKANINISGETSNFVKVNIGWPRVNPNHTTTGDLAWSKRRFIPGLNGTLYWASMESTGIYVKTSTDGGKTWSYLGDRIDSAHGAYTGQDPTMALDSNDYPHVVWYGKNATYTATLKVFYSRWNGASWEAIETIDPVADKYQDNAIICLDKNDVPHVIMSGFVSQYVQAKMQYSNRIGGVWSSWSLIYPDSNDFMQDIGDMTIDGDGLIHVIWVAQSKYLAKFYEEIFYTTKPYDGNTWSDVIRTASKTGTYTKWYPNIAVTDGSDIYITWVTTDNDIGGYDAYYYVKKAKTDPNFSDWQLIDYGSATQTDPAGSHALVTDGSNVWFFYYEYVNTSNSTVRYKKLTNGVSLDSSETVFVNSIHAYPVGMFHLRGTEVNGVVAEDTKIGSKGDFFLYFGVEAVRGAVTKANIDSGLHLSGSVAKAVIATFGSKDFSSIANIKGLLPNSTKSNILVADNVADNNVKASIVRIEVADNAPKANILSEVSKDNSVLGNIFGANQSSNSVTANILRLNETKDNNGKANILQTSTQNNSTKASIVLTLAYDNSTIANIVATYSKDNNVEGNISASGQQTNSVKADILRPDVINSNNALGNVLVIDNTISNSPKASVVRTEAYTNSAKASIVVTSSLDNSVTGNILVTTPKNNSSLANILSSGQVVNSAIANILVVDNVQNNSAKASIVVTSAYDQNAKALIVRTESSNQDTKANILFTDEKANSVIASIINAGQVLNSAVGNILRSDETQNNSTKASIVVINLNDNSAKASIVISSSDDNSAIGNILATISKDNSVKASISSAGENSNSVLANVLRADEVQNNSSKANIALVEQVLDSSSKGNVITTYYTGMTYDWNPSYNERQNRGYQG